MKAEPQKNPCRFKFSKHLVAQLRRDRRVGDEQDQLFLASNRACGTISFGNYVTLRFQAR